LGVENAVKSDVGLASWLFNLYIDPKEERLVGHLLSPWIASMGAEVKEHMATIKKYPPMLEQKIVSNRQR